jgi:hypothetical protein
MKNDTNDQTTRSCKNRRNGNKTPIITRVRGEGKNTNNKERVDETGTIDSGEEETTGQLNRKKITKHNIPYGHICDDVVIENDTPYVRVYCQNVCGIYVREGIGLDAAFQEIKQAGADDIFMFNET